MAPFDDRLLTWKAPVHAGWDFSPRLLAAGIWDDVVLHTARSVCIIDTWVRADWGEKQGVLVKMTLDSDRDQTVELHASLLSMVISNNDLSHKKYLNLKKGLQTIQFLWETAHLEPWNTHDRGFPHLYRLRLQLLDGKGLLDEHETTVGARTIGWGADRGRNLADIVYLNGERLYLRGVNWVPLDLLRGDGMEKKRYRNLLQAAVDAGVNAIRVWGGGGRERKHFYDLCDELGLLVWQELPIACVFLDHLPEDDGYLELARRETTGIVRQLRGHPSLALWGGGNEWGPGRHKRLGQTLGQVMSEEDPSRRWLPASPSPGDSHNWDVWHVKASPQAYAADLAPLLSEFGLAAPPDTKTLTSMLAPDQLWPPGPAWASRKAELDKLRHYARPFLPESEQDISLDQFVAASQEAQARGLQVGIEAYRLRSDAVGTFIWQWNEPWPAICWSIIPYDGSPKRAYAQVACSYAPVAPLARIIARPHRALGRQRPAGLAGPLPTDRHGGWTTDLAGRCDAGGKWSHVGPGNRQAGFRPTAGVAPDRPKSGCPKRLRPHLASRQRAWIPTAFLVTPAGETLGVAVVIVRRGVEVDRVEVGPS